MSVSDPEGNPANNLDGKPAGAPGGKPGSLEEKKKVWVKRIVGLITLFAVLGCIALLVAAMAVTNLFNTILGSSS